MCMCRSDLVFQPSIRMCAYTHKCADALLRSCFALAADAEIATGQATNFVKKAYPASCEAFGVGPMAMVIDRGEEGTAGFLKLAVHPGLAGRTKDGSPDPKAPMPTTAHCRALMDALMQYSYLQRLAFWSVPIKDEGCQSIALFLSQNKSLTSLDITDAGVSTRGCKVIGESLEKNSTLQTLRLDHNRGVDASGVAILGESLMRNLTLSTLSLTLLRTRGQRGGGRVRGRADEGARAPRARAQGQSLRPGGRADAAAALRTCASLFRIDLADTGWGMHPEVHAALEECFENNTTCHEYALGHNPVGDSCVYRWLGMVRKLPHLIFIDVSNQCDPLLFKQTSTRAPPIRRSGSSGRRRRAERRAKEEERRRSRDESFLDRTGA